MTKADIAINSSSEGFVSEGFMVLLWFETRTKVIDITTVRSCLKALIFGPIEDVVTKKVVYHLFDGEVELFSVETHESLPEPTVNEPKVVSQPKVWSDAPIIEEYESDSEDEHVSLPTEEHETPSFANQQVKTPRETIKNQFTNSKNPKVDKKGWDMGLLQKHVLLVMLELAGFSEIEAESTQDYFVLPIWSSYTSTIKSSKANNTGEEPTKHPDFKQVDKEDQVFLDELKRLKRQEHDANDAAKALRKEFAQETKDLLLQAGAAKANMIQKYLHLRKFMKITNGIFTNSSYDDEGAVADFTNLEPVVNVSPIPTSRINSIHPSTLILGDPQSAVQTRSKVTKSSGAHAFIKFPTSNGIATIATTRETLRECRQIEEAQALSRHARVTDPTPMQTSSEVINPRVSLALVETRPRRPGKEPMQLDDMKERRKVMTDEVNEWLKADDKEGRREDGFPYGKGSLLLHEDAFWSQECRDGISEAGRLYLQGVDRGKPRSDKHETQPEEMFIRYGGRKVLGLPSYFGGDKGQP
ncbi:hypothetical protein Tco_0407762 [Tanacetum coccineum]